MPKFSGKRYDSPLRETDIDAASYPHIRTLRIVSNVDRTANDGPGRLEAHRSQRKRHAEGQGDEEEVHAMGTLKAFLVVVIVITGGVSGCSISEVVSKSQQEDRGLGIVLGTLGTMQGTSLPPAGSAAVRGQVLEIEGGAYVLRSLSGDEMRLPLDENTSIDRPAHVGDHIEAYFDEGRRATQVRNIDHQITLER